MVRNVISPHATAYKEKFKEEYELFLKSQNMKREYSMLRFRRKQRAEAGRKSSCSSSRSNSNCS